MKCSLPTDPQKFSPSKVSHYTVVMYGESQRAKLVGDYEKLIGDYRYITHTYMCLSVANEIAVLLQQ